MTSHVLDGHEGFYECAMQTLVYCWQKCIANGGDYVEKECFGAENFLYQVTLVLFVSVVVSMEINKKHYFWSNLHIM